MRELEHPNIVQMYADIRGAEEYGDQNMYYIVMERVEGGKSGASTCKEWLCKHRAMHAAGCAAAAAVAVACARSLRHAAPST